MIIATKLNSTPLQAASVLASDEDDLPLSNELLVENVEKAQSLNLGQSPGDQIQLSAYPNPMRYGSRINFRLPYTSQYELSLYDNNGNRKSIISKGTAQAGYINSAMLNSGTMKNGIYLVRIQTDLGSESISVIINR